MSLARLACCCEGSAPGIVIDVYRELAAYGWNARVYSGQIADPSHCTNEYIGTEPTYEGSTAVSWRCGFSRVHEPFDVYVGGLGHHWNLCTERVHAESVWTASQRWVVPYDNSATEYSSGTWKMETGSGVVTTPATAFIAQVRDNYTVTRDHPSIVSTGDSCHTCATETGSDTSVTVTASYWNRGTYRYNMAAFAVYADSGGNAGWTIEISGGNCVVKDGATVKYAWALASYTIGGLKSAIGATAELSSLGGLAVYSSVSNASATVILDQGPTAVGTVSAPYDLLLRRAGDQFETYQTFGYPRYTVGDFNTSAPLFDGTESQFATGFEIYWTAGAIGTGAHMADIVAPTVTVELSSYGNCFDEEMNAIDPPTYVEPTCSPDGGGVDSVPAGSGRAGFNGDATRARTDSTYEFTSGAAEDGYFLADSSNCNPFDTYYHCAAYTAASFFGKRSKWQLTRT